ncbi:MAG: LysE family transporter [Anaerolineales bacterium]|nr:LysE family transporter [Anaerolineales bacterium]
MSLLAFLSGAFVISLSGVLAPGPVTAVTIGKGGQSPHSGAWIAIGHGIVEIPLMILLALGVGRFLADPTVKIVFGILGGLFLLYMAVGLMREAGRTAVAASSFSGSPLAAGILLSLGNPYFFVWWATVGVALIMQSWVFGLAGFLALIAVHWLCDFFWSYFLSALSFTGGKFFGKWFQRAVFAVCGVALFGFGGWFLYDAVTSLVA